MTYKELYRQAKQILTKAGCDSPAFDAISLLSHCLGIDRQGLIMQGENEAPPLGAAQYLALTGRRAQGEPLQYLLGTWEFMGRSFFVGSGVLIPREDTQAIIEETLSRLKNIPSPHILDLCAGSGAIAVTLAKELPGSTVTALELSDDALSYLKKNIARHNAKNAAAVKGDVFESYRGFAYGPFDAVVSNPPYIESKEIAALQKEIFFEPRMALDGGADGLAFYRAITEHWAPLLRRGGLMAFEVGENQAQPVKELMRMHGFDSIRFQKDIMGTDRCVSGVRL